jgi:inosine-uridine nucleoside N-ribohydrolase
MIVLMVLGLLLGVGGGAAQASSSQGALPTQAVWVDGDFGIDDSFALAYVLRTRQLRLLGVSTVFGNTSVENASNNALTVLDAASSTVPVVVGAAAPRVYSRSRVGAFVHGPDGLWFNQQPHNLAVLNHDAPAAIAQAVQANPQGIVLALGPLTNIAAALERFPQVMAGAHVVAIAGTNTTTGNRTRVAETNVFNDPQALAVVLAARIDLTMVSRDTFDTIQVNPATFAAQLAQSDDPLAQLLSRILPAYAYALTQGSGAKVALPDVAAALFVRYRSATTTSSALAIVVSEPALVRGLLVVATNPNDKLSMIADDNELSALSDQLFTNPNFNLHAAMGAILARQPDNSAVVLSVPSRSWGGKLVRTFVPNATMDDDNV